MVDFTSPDSTLWVTIMGVVSKSLVMIFSMLLVRKGTTLDMMTLSTISFSTPLEAKSEEKMTEYSSPVFLVSVKTLKGLFHCPSFSTATTMLVFPMSTTTVIRLQLLPYDLRKPCLSWPLRLHPQDSRQISPSCR